MNYIERATKGTRWEASLDGGKTWRRCVPISFTAALAQRCFDGQKTQTRRLMKPQLPDSGPAPWPNADGGFMLDGVRYSPRYRVGDMLYIREPWRTDVLLDKLKPSALNGGEPIWFAGEPQEKHPCYRPGKLRPAMFLQRRFARLARYQITAVRCERVNEISEEDAEAEGIEWRQYGIYPKRSTTICRNGFEKLWNSIHTERGTHFEDGPWVWAYTFKRVR